MQHGLPPLRIRRHAEGACPGAISVIMDQPGKSVFVLDLELMQRLEATLQLVPRDATGLILESCAEKVYIAGADLHSIRDLSDEQLEKYLAYGASVFSMLHEFPFPTVAAINGAALGGGLELAMHCDALVSSPPPLKDGKPGKPYPLGLPEAGLSICPGWGGASLLPARMDPAEAIRRTATGATISFDEAKEFGLFADVADNRDELDDTCLDWLGGNFDAPAKRDGAPLRWAGRPETRAATLKALDEVRSELPDTPSARAVAAAIDAGLSGGWKAALESERQSLVHLRHTPEAKKAIDAFFAKSGGPKA